VAAAIPPSSEQLPPGSLIRIGVDGNGADMYAKVRWSRSDIEKTYPSVTWTPTRTMDINPMGIKYHVVDRQQITTPQIVKDIFDQTIEGERIESLKYRAITPQEAHDYAEAAANQPGTRVWSRLYRSGFGLGVRQSEPGEEIA
jgi:hypothetical protein